VKPTNICCEPKLDHRLQPDRTCGRVVGYALLMSIKNALLRPAALIVGDLRLADRNQLHLHQPRIVITCERLILL
jgi:hypothetical protein